MTATAYVEQRGCTARWAVEALQRVLRRELPALFDSSMLDGIRDHVRGFVSGESDRRKRLELEMMRKKKRWVGRAAAALMMTPRSCRVGTWAGVATSRQLAASGPTATPAAIYGPRIAATGKRWAVAGSCFGQASGSDSGEQAMGASYRHPAQHCLCRQALAPSLPPPTCCCFSRRRPATSLVEHAAP